MIISDKHKYIFISSPKTGSQSIRDYLLQVDNSAQWNSFSLDNTRYTADEHITAYRLSQLIGEKYNSFNVIAFIRNPYSKALSGYFFYRNGKALHEKGQRVLLIRLNILLSRILPFPMWALIKPVKSNKEYLTNKEGNIIVGHIGRTENLTHDFSLICEKLNLSFDGKGVSVKNKSRYKEERDYFANPLFKRLFDFKHKRDLAFYKKVTETVIANQ